MLCQMSINYMKNCNSIHKLHLSSSSSVCVHFCMPTLFYSPLFPFNHWFASRVKYENDFHPSFRSSIRNTSILKHHLTKLAYLVDWLFSYSLPWFCLTILHKSYRTLTIVSFMRLFERCKWRCGFITDTGLIRVST